MSISICDIYIYLCDIYIYIHMQHLKNIYIYIFLHRNKVTHQPVDIFMFGFKSLNLG